MSKITLYYMDMSPPSRTVKYLAEQLELDIEYIQVTIFENDQKTESYLKMNPLQTIPTLVDDDIILSDSHAIMMYLVDKYAESDSLYPRDVVKRAKVNSILFFENQFLFSRQRTAMEPVVYDGHNEFDPYLFEKVPDSLNRLNRLLAHGQKFVAGDQVTIADFSCLPTTNNMKFWDCDADTKYSNITAWRERFFELYPDIEKRETSMIEKLHIFAMDLLSSRIDE